MSPRFHVVRHGLAAALILLCAGPVLAATKGSTQAIPARPEKLSYPTLDFEVPPAAPYYHQLSNGIPVYVAEDHTLPLVNVSITLKVGDFLEDSSVKPGVASLTGSMIRRGGTAQHSAEEFDEKVDFLAANMGTFGADTSSGANLNCITGVLDGALDLFFEMLRTPGFDGGRFEVEKSNRLEAMKQRNDDAGDILNREWRWLLYGHDYFGARQLTAAELETVGRDDLVAFHDRYWRPENMIVTVSGDVDTKKVLARLEKELTTWQGSGEAASWPPPVPGFEPAPGLYHVEKDIPQAKVFIGHQGLQWHDWDDPDAAPLQVMNEILGAGGFTSRLVKRIRSDEGLAYSAGSVFTIEPFRPGQFYMLFQSKNPTVALASKIAIEELGRIRDEPVSDAELQLAKQSLIETFPRRFESPRAVVGVYTQDTFQGRPHEYWQKWRDRVRAVTAADVQRVAREHLHPDGLVFLVVGPWEQIVGGDADQRANMKDLFEGQVTHLPQRDPLTLEPRP